MDLILPSVPLLDGIVHVLVHVQVHTKLVLFQPITEVPTLYTGHEEYCMPEEFESRNGTSVRLPPPQAE